MTGKLITALLASAIALLAQSMPADYESVLKTLGK